MGAKERMHELVEFLHSCNHKYYIEDQSLVSDKEFDLLLAELQSLEQEHPEWMDPNSPTKRVGGGLSKKFETVQHDYPMLSLSNSYSLDDLQEFEQRNKKVFEGEFSYTAELKYDGVAIALKYVDGQLLRALTRGDGVQGDDVTENVRTIKSIPLRLQGNYPSELEIRGEVYLSKASFAELNQRRAEAGEQLMANPRNTASGTLKMQDSAEVASRNLDCFLYHLIAKAAGETHYLSLEKARSWGFVTPSPKLDYIRPCASLEEVMIFIKEWDAKRHDLPFEVDGVVVKVDQLDVQEILGKTAKSPRWAIAYKFETEQAETNLESVDYQVGRTGAVTPVANLTPVLLLGTTVKRASLHNEDFIKSMALHYNDRVKVEKGGEIIPKVVGVLTEQRAEGAKEVEHIKHCPECGSELERTEGEANYYCLNTLGCRPQIIGRIQHFISRKAMDIDGLGGETIALLFDNDLIKCSADLYDLTAEQLLPLERMAEKSVNNILDGIQQSKRVDFSRVLFALGIRHVGQTVAKKLAQSFGTLTKLEQATNEELVAVDEIGEVIAESVVEYFSSENNKEELGRLKHHGLQFEMVQEEKQSTLLDGLTFVVSGVFENFSRDELKALVEMNGGKIASSISKKTSYVVAGDKMGPSKRLKAEKLAVPIISEQEVQQMLSL